jgi:hypothetical protein
MSESPFVDQGSTRGAFEKIRQVRPDCSIVLTGRQGVHVCGPTDRISRWSLWSQQYDHYVVVSGRRIKVVRQETMLSRDPRFELDLSIEMDVSVTDPREFVRLYGADGDVTMPFYTTFLSDLRSRARNRVAAEINGLNEELQEVSKKIRDGGASHGPVTIHAIDMHAQISKRAMEIFQAMSIHDIAAEHGDAFLLALITQTEDEARKRAYVDYYNERRKKEREDLADGREARDDYAAFISKTFEDDPMMRKKLLTDPALLDSMKAVFAQRQRVLIANRPVTESLVPADTKPRQLLRGPDTARE